MFNIKLKLKNFTKFCIVKLNYYLGNYKSVIWIVGDGRSGTTWVANLINHDKRYREMFEPVHPQRVSPFSFLRPHEYVRPEDFTGKIEEIFKDMFSGKFSHKSVDRDNHTLFFQSILIKDIFVNLLCYSAVKKFPDVKPILLIRNPFAVAASKQKKQMWFWETEPLKFLQQKHLVDDFLSPFEELIRSTSAKKNFTLNQVLIWAIINYIPIRQFSNNGLHICFYEQIYASPKVEIKKIVSFVNGAEAAEQFQLAEDKINAPSRVVGKASNILSGTSPITSWQQEISDEIYQQGNEILRHFGLADLYDESSMPRPEVVERIQKISYFKPQVALK